MEGELLMDKISIIKKLGEDKLVAVIRASSRDEGIAICDAVRKGGIRFLEITFTVPKAAAIIEELTDRYADEDVIIGAGTVLDAETARAAILAGAQFLVSPCFDEAMVKLCNRYRVPVLPGAQTIGEVMKCLEAGADVVKVFPGDAYKPGILKSFHGPIPQGLFMPTGGVSIENVQEWLNAGAYAVGTGSSLTKGAKTGDYEAVTREARRFVEAVKQG